MSTAIKVNQVTSHNICKQLNLYCPNRLTHTGTHTAAGPDSHTGTHTHTHTGTHTVAHSPLSLSLTHSHTDTHTHTHSFPLSLFLYEQFEIRGAAPTMLTRRDVERSEERRVWQECR